MHSYSEIVTVFNHGTWAWKSDPSYTTMTVNVVFV